ncbi:MULTISPECIES: SAM-dependent methyltransferase [unclassified Streptomyces]|uniref:SAM-dependent methyltransferase n=1 Tax=unclassified Streptomyces TaxID=2593676 RepID=UPI002E2D9D6F|nr:SAM-dependent methyltransferase [Streptomyces sp. NBC_01439]
MDLQTFRTLLTDEGQSLLAALQEAGPEGGPESAATAAVRQGRPAALVAAAEEQVRLRGLAAAKFGEFAPQMYFTPDLVELSSHLTVSDYKLHRVLDEVGVVLIEAICLGSSADALVLSWSHHTTAFDADPLTVEIAAANAPVVNDGMFFPQCEDATRFGSQGEAVFIDLVRRPGPDGRHDPESYDLPLSWALERVRETGLGWIRLVPDLPRGALPGLGRAAEAEWISYAGAVQELVLWFGLHHEPAPVTVRKATVLPAGASLTARGLPEPSVRPPGRYVYVPDPAVIGAGLVAEVAEDVTGGPLDGGGALLTSDELRHTPFATAYEVVEVPEHAREPAGSVKFVVAGADGPVTLRAVPVPAPVPARSREAP